MTLSFNASLTQNQKKKNYDFFRKEKLFLSSQNEGIFSGRINYNSIIIMYWHKSIRNEMTRHFKMIFF